jgi:enoyl-CoA hydratase/carnithine racemase
VSTVRLDRHGPVAVVTLDRPERLNAISIALTKDLHAALAEAGADDAVRAIVLTGAGRAFCAGDDLDEFPVQSATEESARAHIAAIQQITRDMLGAPKPVVAAARGYAVGGGFEWLVNADLAIAGDDLVAFFPELTIGQFPTGGVTWLLPLAVGHQRAMELLLLGHRQRAERLRELGLVLRVVPAADVVDEALRLAEELATRAPESVARLKRLVHAELHGLLERALELEEAHTVATFATPFAAAAARRFAERRG